MTPTRKGVPDRPPCRTQGTTVTPLVTEHLSGLRTTGTVGETGSMSVSMQCLEDVLTPTPLSSPVTRVVFVGVDPRTFLDLGGEEEEDEGRSRKVGDLDYP